MITMMQLPSTQNRIVLATRDYHFSIVLVRMKVTQCGVWRMALLLTNGMVLPVSGRCWGGLIAWARAYISDRKLRGC